jgi:hypothetical protein
MFRHPFESEWHHQWHEQEIKALVRHRQFSAARSPERRIRRFVGRSIVSIGSFIGRSMVRIGHRLAAEPARSVARSR